ncbi:S41 family peptidase [Taklimakanibacter lacteus]|uniref:S41 family peptidase n=1 Tax=Taklimakanibacter lacteus TaxID=2268456 RepID=UPI000E675A6D
MTRARQRGGRRGGENGGGARPLEFSWADRLDILDGLSVLIEQIYVHLPLKRSLYGFDIIRALQALRLQSTTLTDLQFHRELTTLVNRLRDAHTQYQAPWTKKGVVKTLPFLVEAYGPPGDVTYIVSKLAVGAKLGKSFAEGVVITHWNGMDFERAVDLHAEVETGGRPDARQARALESMTLRALEYAPPPDEEWVDIGYRDNLHRKRTIRLAWDDVVPEFAPNAAGMSLATRFRRSINLGAEAVRRAKKFQFNRGYWEAERRAAAISDPKKRLTAEFQDFLTAEPRKTPSGVFGYLRIWSFDVDDDRRFIDAASALVQDLPDRGLIIDIRNNPGGLIWAAERLLQIFTPHPIEPTRFALRATRFTAEMARAVFNRDEFGAWTESLSSAESTGEPYSAHIPITPPEQCNDLGQRYGGPVVVVADANTYSSGDLFAAGIVDNRIGPLICVGQATGAGGANVWSARDIADALRPANLPVPKFPKGVDFTMSIRRAVRASAAGGALIEDGGVSGQTYVMTGVDVFNKNQDLIDHCGRILAAQPWTRMNVKRRGSEFEVETAGLDRLDVFVSGHPARSYRLKRDGRQRFKLRPKKNQMVEIVGFDKETVRQRRRIPID